MREAKKATVGKCEGRKAYGEKAGEADVLALMRSLRRKKNGKRMSYARIAEELNNREMPTRTGAKWHTTTVQNILKRKIP